MKRSEIIIRSLNPATIELDFDKALGWLQNGALPTDTCRAILSYKGVLIKKHLLEGVKKGAFDEAEANRRFEEWMKQNEAKIEAKKSGLEKSQDDDLDKRLSGEKRINEARVAKLAKKNAELAAKAAAGLKEIVSAQEAEPADEPVLTEESAPVEESTLVEDTAATEVKNPAGEETASEPAAEDIASEPAAEETASEPAAEETASEPAAEETASEPAAEETASEPAAEETASEPAAVRLPRSQLQKISPRSSCQA